MSLVTDFLVNEGISLANPLIVSEEELELQKAHDADPDDFKLILEAAETLTKKLVPHITGTSVGAKAALAFLADLDTATKASAVANGVTF